MKPDQQSNYWQHDPEQDQAVKEPELYTPTPFEPEQDPTPAETQPNTPPLTESVDPVHWTANEYIHLEKNGWWFVLFTLVVFALIAIDLFVLKSYSFSVVVIVMAVAVIVYSRRPPRALDYTLSGAQGLYVGERLYHFNEFKSFGLIKDGDHHSIMLIPTKRFSPGVSVYFPEEVGEQIVDILGARLPMESLKLDIIDVVVRKLRL